jgi:GMP synthase-like glutamine amidotransferase
MKIHFFQHVPYFNLGVLEPRFKKPGNSLTGTKFFEDHKLPFIDICDLLVISGGPMSIYDESQYAWMNKEKKFIEQALQKGKKVLGIGLGAHLLADALGAKVYQNQEKELGWLDISKTAEAESLELLKEFGATEKVFHWHSDTYDLPESSINLFQREGFKNQAFLYKEQALGLQFHLELTENNINALFENSDLQKNNHDPSNLIQPVHIERTNSLAHNLIQQFINI